MLRRSEEKKLVARRFGSLYMYLYATYGTYVKYTKARARAKYKRTNVYIYIFFFFRCAVQRFAAGIGVNNDGKREEMERRKIAAMCT